MTHEMKRKMNARFRGIEGGLFSAVEKADVGDGFERLQENGVDMMSWADPFMPDAAVPEHVKQAALQAMRDSGELARLSEKYFGSDITNAD